MTGNNNIPAPERSKGEMGVMVKPLEWVDGERGFPTDANTIIGRYRVWDFDGEDSHYMRPEDRAGLYVGGNLDHAKAAAQADYEQRILSTLETPPLSKEGEAAPVAYTDPRAIALLRGTPAQKVYLTKTQTAAYSMPLYAAPVPVTITDEMAARALPHLIGVEGSAVRPVGQFWPGMTADESEDANWQHYGIERVKNAFTAALSAKPGEQG